MFKYTTKLKWTKAFLWVVLIGLTATTTTDPIITYAEASNVSVEIGYDVGQQAPDFTLPQLGGGDPIQLQEQVEQYDVTVLYFFFAAT